jgi:hypothetical protein
VTFASIGTNTAAAATNVVITSGVNVPAGSLIIVAFDKNNQTTTTQTCVDTATGGSNTYAAPQAINYNSTFSRGGFFYTFNCHALSIGGTITVTLDPSVNLAIAASAFYWDGASTTDPRQSGIQATASNAGSTSPTAALTGAPTANSLVVGFVASDSPNTDTFTQDSTHAAYQNFPVISTVTGGNNRQVVGGTVISSSALTYAPTITSRPWGIIVSAFTAAAAAGTPVTITLTSGTFQTVTRTVG